MPTTEIIESSTLTKRIANSLDASDVTRSFDYEKWRIYGIEIMLSLNAIILFIYYVYLYKKKSALRKRRNETGNELIDRNILYSE